MKSRQRILVISLWLSVLALSTWVGGTLYQMIVVVPLWAESPPESVRAFFQGTDYNRTILNFFGPPFILARNLPLLVALISGWHLPRHRRALLVALTCFFGFGVPFTVAFVYPINAVLFQQAGGYARPEEILRMVEQWVLLDRVRFAVGTIGFLAVLHAFRLPLPQPHSAPGSEAT